MREAARSKFEEDSRAAEQSAVAVIDTRPLKSITTEELLTIVKPSGEIPSTLKEILGDKSKETKEKKEKGGE
jgi:hypothetical protein